MFFLLHSCLIRPIFFQSNLQLLSQIGQVWVIIDQFLAFKTGGVIGVNKTLSLFSHLLRTRRLQKSRLS